jgi:hypothetical protein
MGGVSCLLCYARRFFERRSLLRMLAHSGALQFQPIEPLGDSYRFSSSVEVFEDIGPLCRIIEYGGEWTIE